MVEADTLPFETFWGWLVTHPNCIVRAGTPETVIYDDEDLYWHFAAEAPDTLVVQVLRGKRLVGEILISPEQIAFVDSVGGEVEDEFVFELISESDAGRVAAYFFVLVHGYEEEGASAGPVH